MQGEGTAEGVIRAFNALLSVPDLDVAVLTRGGGSATDLGWFDDPGIARTIAQLPWPVISGIGHETDSTLPDFAAHTRAKTPTHAADILVNWTADFLEELNSLASVLERSATRSISTERIRLAALAESLSRSAGMACRGRLRELRSTSAWLLSHVTGSLHSSGKLLERAAAFLGPGRTSAAFVRKRGTLAATAVRLASAVDVRLSTTGLILDRLAEAVRGSDPARLYRAGWATVTDASGLAVRSVRQVGTGGTISVKVQDGSIESIVDRTISGRAPRKTSRGALRKRTDNE
jgi:exodeoxyribonuclease VII large subunit